MRKAIGAAAVAAVVAFGATGCKMERGSDAQHPATQGEVVKPRAGEETPATGGSGQDTGAATAPSEEYPAKTQPQQRNEDEAQQGQGNPSKGFQGEGYKR